MNKILFSIAIAFCFLPIRAFADSSAAPLQTVSSIDLNLYAGRWFEIASIPQFFQRNCVGNVTADYGLRKDGTVSVLNSCRQKDNSMSIANGSAKIADEQNHAKLQVTFVRVLGNWLYLLGGDYWVIDLAPDYSYAVVGHPQRTYAWILARTPSIAKPDLLKIESRMREQGYDTCQLLTTVQDGGAFTSRQPLCKAIHAGE